MKIKYYYEAKSQKELDYLLEYCEKAGANISKGNKISDFKNGQINIGAIKGSGNIFCTRHKNDLRGELTTDIEVFKSQFKTTNMKSLKEVQAVVGESFAVKWENSPEFKSYIEWINGNGREMNGLSSGRFYGVEYGDFVCQFLENYPDNTKVLTAKEIMAIISERTIEDIDREVEALLKEKAELEAEQPLSIIWDVDEHCFNVGDDTQTVFVSEIDNAFAPKGHSLYIDTKKFDIKTYNKNGLTYITFHKKVI